jgi:hydrogenase-4 transcriptional activator
VIYDRELPSIMTGIPSNVLDQPADPPPMASSSEIILRVWQEVCRHLEIAESGTAVAALLIDHLPLDRFTVHRFEPEHRRVRLVAAFPENDQALDPGDIHLSDDAAKNLERWIRRREATHHSAEPGKAEKIFAALGMAERGGDSLLAPLVGEHGSSGILLASTPDGRRISHHQARLLASFAEPLGAALDNDARLHEMASLREAAEAERRSLLVRLGRKDAGETIVGEDSGLRHVMQRVDMVSRSDVPVLILGETGTGKELVARSIHNRSDRHNGPFIRVNCGAIPRELIDSQLFGHEKGSFTGAADTRQGWFERADMGTLFLDEIGELPLDAQVRFLRVLQDGFVERVGSADPIRVNVRVVAATHRDLASMVRESTFREDLWYRIAVFPILLPPLRERREDIPAIARHFAERAAVRFGLAPVMPNEADIQLLESYDWPGNIRELGTVIDRAAILGNGRTLELAAALGLAIPRRHVSVAVTTPPPLTQAINGSTALATLESAMKAHIEAGLRLTNGRIEGPHGAARLLAINPHTLRARMRKLRIDWSAFRGDDGDDGDE